MSLGVYRNLLVSGSDGVIWIHNVEDGAIVEKDEEFHAGTEVHVIKIEKDRLVTGGRNGKVGVFQLSENGKTLERIIEHGNQIFDLDLDENRLVTVGNVGENGDEIKVRFEWIYCKKSRMFPALEHSQRRTSHLLLRP